MSAERELALVCSLAGISGVKTQGWTERLDVLRESNTTIDSLCDLSIDELSRLFYLSEQQSIEVGESQKILRETASSMAARNIRVITSLHPNPPKWFCKVGLPWLFYQGNMSVLDRPAIGFSGSRDASQAALTIASESAAQAHRLGQTVVSGGARGVDLSAHSGALAAGGTTVFVLAQGLGTWNPPFRQLLLRSPDRVLAVSEYVIWEEWGSVNAMRRNQLIVDLSRGLIVPQSGLDGGTHFTATYAMNRGRTPTFVADLGSEFAGNQDLLRKGASRIPMLEGSPDIATLLEIVSNTPKTSQPRLF